MDNVFLNKISSRFLSIKEKFKNQIQKFGYKYDDDVFYDTMLKCNDKLDNDDMTYNEMLNYFWGAFKTNTVRELEYSRNKKKDGESAITENIEDETYDESDYCAVSKMIINEFGFDLYKLFCLHANGVPYKKLVKTNDKNELHYKFKQIREYVRKNYKKD